MDDEERERQIEEFKKNSKTAGGDRISADAHPREEAIERLEYYLTEVHDGDISRSVSFYDPGMAAILAYLEEDSARLTEIVATAQEELGRDVDREEADRAELIRLICRVGLAELDEDLLDETGEANQNRINRNARQI